MKPPSLEKPTLPCCIYNSLISAINCYPTAKEHPLAILISTGPLQTILLGRTAMHQPGTRRFSTASLRLLLASPSDGPLPARATNAALDGASHGSTGPEKAVVHHGAHLTSVSGLDSRSDTSGQSPIQRSRTAACAQGWTTGQRRCARLPAPAGVALIRKRHRLRGPRQDRSPCSRRMNSDSSHQRFRLYGLWTPCRLL